MTDESRALKILVFCGLQIAGAAEAWLPGHSSATGQKVLTSQKLPSLGDCRLIDLQGGWDNELRIILGSCLRDLRCN